jgi:hypothetical protein
VEKFTHPSSAASVASSRNGVQSEPDTTPWASCPEFTVCTGRPIEVTRMTRGTLIWINELGWVQAGHLASARTSCIEVTKLADRQRITDGVANRHRLDERPRRGVRTDRLERRTERVLCERFNHCHRRQPNRE